VSGAFAAAALDLFAAGLAVIPLGGAKGQTPLVDRWNQWKRRPGPTFINKLAAEHPDANVGVICGLSGATVLDIDDPSLLPLMIERFGDTQLRTHTPRGGVHLWYKNSGEGCPKTLRRDGLAVDVKGIGGYVVAPPSIRFSGEHAGRSYGFLAGSWHDIRHLPPIRSGALSGVSISAPMRSRAVKEGDRNDTLFCQLLRHEKACDNPEALLDVANWINSNFEPPLDSAEVAKVVASVWRIRIEGRNWVGEEQRVYTFKSELEAFAAHPNGGDGHLLFSKLRMSHWGHDRFPVSCKAMALQQVFPGWGVKRYRVALGAITDVELLEQVHHGGRCPGDVSLFSFPSRVSSKGALKTPKITDTPSPSAPGGTERGRAASVEHLPRLITLTMGWENFGANANSTDAGSAADIRPTKASMGGRR